MEMTACEVTNNGFAGIDVGSDGCVRITESNVSDQANGTGIIGRGPAAFSVTKTRLERNGRGGLKSLNAMPRSHLFRRCDRGGFRSQKWMD
jgi:ketosteroid isomerase-like protein